MLYTKSFQYILVNSITWHGGKRVGRVKIKVSGVSHSGQIKLNTCQASSLSFIIGKVRLKIPSDTTDIVNEMGVSIIVINIVLSVIKKKIFFLEI